MRGLQLPYILHLPADAQTRGRLEELDALSTLASFWLMSTGHALLAAANLCSTLTRAWALISVSCAGGCDTAHCDDEALEASTEALMLPTTVRHLWHRKALLLVPQMPAAQKPSDVSWRP